MEQDSFKPVHVTSSPAPQADLPQMAEETTDNISFERAFFTAIGFAAFFLTLGAIVLSRMV